MSVPVISVARMREWEQASWAAGRTEADVIQRVGQAVAERLLALTRPGDTLLLLAGCGHNGDDARAAAPHLLNRRVEQIDAADPTTALAQFREKCGSGAGVPKPAWIIDGLFGLGLNRPLAADWRELIGAINNSGRPILAIDTPSGLNADTGDTGESAIRATVTLTVGAPKRGLLRPGCEAHVGRLEVLDEVGLIPCPFAEDLVWTLPADFADFPPRRPVAGHKGNFGHLNIFAGSLGYHGAAVLAARGALRAQPGLVTLHTQEMVFLPVAGQLQAAMVQPWKPANPLPKSCSALLFGPGLAGENIPDQLKTKMRALWQSSPLPMVVDASALDWLRPGPVSEAARVITPHPGEAARLLGSTPEKVQADRVESLRELSRRFGNCFVALKGHQTLVGRGTGPIYINGSGNPYLAQGGSGDVLAGFLAGLLAQPALQATPLLTLRYAVWQHGAAADALCRARPDWTIEDLADELIEGQSTR